MLGTKHGLAPWYRHPMTWFSVISFFWLAETSQAEIIFQDDFQYVADRNVTNVQIPFEAHRWTDAKAQNSDYASGGGYLYTQQDATRGSRVLVMESLPSTSQGQQTAYHLQYGSVSHPPGTIPANVWFQFWTYATPESRWNRQKFLYPCHTSYPCPVGEYLWLLSFNAIDLTGVGDNSIQAPAGGRFFRLSSAYANNMGGASWNADKLYQNVRHTPLLAGVWYEVRVHFDTSGPQGIYELWIRERGVTTWTKLAEWIGGVTPNFDWPIPSNRRSGNVVLSLPTTVDNLDSTTYMDDFTMATSVNDLGGSSGDTTPPLTPQNLRAVP